MRNLGTLINDLQRFGASANKIIEVYYSRPLIADRPDALPHPRSRGKIEFRGVSFSPVSYTHLDVYKRQLLDAIVDFMPSPTDVPAIKGINPATEEEVERHSSDTEPFAALAFKIATDPFVGKLCFFRVYSGTVAAGSAVFNANKNNTERLGRILQMHSNHRKDIEVVYAGDIAAAVGLKNTTTGDSLCDEKNPVILEMCIRDRRQLP